MLKATPVVAADSGGNAEIIRNHETGRLIPPNDPEAMAEAARDVLEDPKSAARMATTARELNKGRFSMASHRASIMGVYDSILR